MSMKYQSDEVMNLFTLARWREGELILPKSSYFAASQLVLCPRAVFYSKTIKPSDPLSIESLRVMSFGEEIHNSTYKWIDQIGLYSPLGEERSFNSDLYNISFRTDKFIFWNKEHFIVEVKSINRFKFDGTKYIPSIKDTPDEGHCNQLQIYMNLLGYRGYLLYINRETGMPHWVLVEPDEEVFKAMTKRSSEITAALESKKVMDRPHSCIIDKDGIPKKEQTRQGQKYKSDWQCFYGKGWCKYLSHCYKDQGIDPHWREKVEAK